MHHPESDPTAVEPDDIAAPSPEVEQTVPREEDTPDDYEPQSELREGQEPGIVEREVDLAADTEDRENDVDMTDGEADDGDDDTADD